MFFLQNEFLCRFVILSFTKGFHSQHMSCTILRTHSLCVNGVSDILRFFNIWQGHPECLYSMKHDSAFMTSVTFIHILQMSFKLAVVQTSLRFTLVPLLLTALVWGNPTVGLTSNTLNSDPNLTISLGVGKWVPHSNRTKEQEVRKLKVHTEYNGRSLSTLQEMFEIGMVWVSQQWALQYGLECETVRDFK